MKSFQMRMCSSYAQIGNKIIENASLKGNKKRNEKKKRETNGIAATAASQTHAKINTPQNTHFNVAQIIQTLRLIVIVMLLRLEKDETKVILFTSLVLGVVDLMCICLLHIWLVLRCECTSVPKQTTFQKIKHSNKNKPILVLKVVLSFWFQSSTALVVFLS